LRVWVARAEPAAARTAARLGELGHAPLVAPVLAVRPTGAPLPDGWFDALVITSANAADALTEADAARLAGLPVYAVGRRTAERARRAGLGPVETAEGDAAALAALIAERMPPGARLLHAAGRERKAEPAASLAASGHTLTAWIVYEAAAVPVLPEPAATALRRGEVDAALHYSRRSAGTALRLSRDAGLEHSFARLRHVCLSADVAAPLEAAGLPIHFVPARPSEDDLLAGLA